MSARIAGVKAPAFIERGWTYLKAGGTSWIAGVKAPAFIERAESH